ncbi:hypothetical protein OO012_18590 [Rhodobacteraceae bacterium KMM 6894]|nr:hypothetical protein [Rhodobacteraceae bacterium KMM 6894]
MTDDTLAKKKRFRSPPYPSFDLGRAVERVALLDKVAQHHEVGVGVLTEAWGMKSADGQVWRSAAALIQYGLVTDSGTGKTRKFKITDPARRIVRDPDPDSEKRRTALRTAALLPMIHNVLWKRFGSANDISDSVIKAYLTLDRLDEGETPYSSSAAAEVISSYRKTLEFADLTNASSMHLEGTKEANTAEDDEVTLPDTGNDGAGLSANAPPKSPVVVNIGDFIQWESQGALQFDKPKRVRWISDDRSHIAVEGSETGIPVQQITLESKPVAASVPQSPPPLEPKPSKGMRHEEKAVEKQWLDGTPAPAGISTKPIVFDMETVSGSYSYDNANDLADFISKLEKIRELLPNKG